MTPVEVWSALTRVQRNMLLAIVQNPATALTSRMPRRTLENYKLVERVRLDRSPEGGSMFTWLATPLGRQVATPPLVFLDMDGVCARVIHRPRRHGESEDAWKARQAPALERLDAPSMLRLTKIANMTDARFVMSSTWRRTENATPRHYEAVMQLKGFKGQLVGFTPVHPAGSREGEIEAYLQSLPAQPRAFAILEDFEPMHRLADRTVRTNEDTLISDADVERVVKLLLPPAWTVRKKGARGTWRLMYEGSEPQAWRRYERYAKRALRGAVELLGPDGQLVEGQTFA